MADLVSIKHSVNAVPLLRSSPVIRERRRRAISTSSKLPPSAHCSGDEEEEEDDDDDGSPLCSLELMNCLKTVVSLKQFPFSVGCTGSLNWISTGS